jgi:hypothetical protein
MIGSDYLCICVIENNFGKNLKKNGKWNKKVGLERASEIFYFLWQ